MNACRLTVIVSLCMGMASAAQNALSRECDGNCGNSNCAACCDDKGLLNRLGAAAHQFDQSLRPKTSSSKSQSACDCKGTKGECDALPTQCPNCARPHSGSHIPSQEPKSVPYYAPQNAPSTMAPDPVPHRSQPLPNHSPAPAHDSHANPADMVPPPMPNDANDDAKVDPFKDDSASYWKRSKFGIQSATYVRRISGRDEPGSTESQTYDAAFDPQAAVAARRAMTLAGTSTPKREVARSLSNSVSRENALSNERSSRHLQSPVRPAVGSNQLAPAVIPASAAESRTSLASPQKSESRFQFSDSEENVTQTELPLQDELPQNPLRLR